MNYVEYEYLFLLNDNWKGLDFLDTFSFGKTIEDLRPINFLSSEEHATLSKNNPEKELIRKEFIISLSKRGKEVIEVIFNSPAEVLNIFLSKKGTFIRREKLKDYLVHKKGWKYREVEEVFQELSEYVKDIDKLF